MTGYICIAMLEDPPYNLIVAATASAPKDWCAKLPLPSHLLCFEAFKNPDIMFNQFIQRLKTDGISVKTDKAFPARPHEVIRVFNQIRDEAFNSQPVTKEVIDVEKREWSHGQIKEMNVVLKKSAVTEYQRVLTANVSTSMPSLAEHERIGKFTVQDGIAEDTETGLMWLRFADGQTWQNGTVVGNARKINWNKAFEIAKQFNQQGGYAGYSDWRLPTIDELKSLIDKVKGKSGNTIDTEVFPKNAPWLWSSSPGTGGARIVYFNYGNGGIDSKDCNNAVRLVRCTKEMNVVLKKADETEHQQALTADVSTSMPSLAEHERIGKFTVQDGIAEDTETGLVWLRFAHGQTWQNGTTVGDAKNVDWNQALEIAKQFNQQGGYAGYSDWRLPTIDELKTLIDKIEGNSGNTISIDIFPKNAQRFWSSSPLAGNTGCAWIVNFSNGNGGYGEGKSYFCNYTVRLVRGKTIDKPAGNQIHSAAKVR